MTDKILLYQTIAPDSRNYCRQNHRVLLQKHLPPDASVHILFPRTATGFPAIAKICGLMFPIPYSKIRAGMTLFSP
ncbi:MAG: hypothetical protein NUV76_06885 [Candidatus Kuenenia sp.]|nr:hypothetical protein [Candidatus Kuenenia sp.]